MKGSNRGLLYTMFAPGNAWYPSSKTMPSTWYYLIIGDRSFGGVMVSLGLDMLVLVLATVSPGAKPGSPTMLLTSGKPAQMCFMLLFNTRRPVFSGAWRLLLALIC